MRKKHESHKWEYHKVFLSLQVHLCSRHLLGGCSTAKDCKGNGRSGPCRSGIYNLMRNTRHTYMKQLENNPQVLQKQEDGEGWVLYYFLKGKGFVPIWLVEIRRGNSRSDKARVPILYSCSLEQYNRDFSVIWLKCQPWPLRNCVTLSPFLTSGRKE